MFVIPSMNLATGFLCRQPPRKPHRPSGGTVEMDIRPESTDMAQQREGAARTSVQTAPEVGSRGLG
jgi:hypothetical protein